MKVAYERFEGSYQFFADKAPVIGFFVDMNSAYYLTRRKETNSHILKFILGCETWQNNRKEIILRLNNE